MHSSSPSASQTHWWHRDGDKVVCELCPRNCIIKPGQRGFCFVRANIESALVLTTFGRSSGFCIDPIEKKPLHHFLPGTPVLSLGTAGCNLACRFCQNWDISKSRDIDTLASEATPEQIVEAAVHHGCPSIAFTYNDPTTWAEYVIATAQVARARGVKTVAVTAGYINAEPRRELYRWIDAANVDLKGFTEEFYQQQTRSQLAPVLETLRYLKHETSVWFEITNLIIPGENDTPEETRRMCEWIVTELGPDVPVHFTAFHPDYLMLDKPHTPLATLARARDIARAVGVRYAYIGNIADPARESTWCDKCGTLLIARQRYEIGQYALERNHCRACGAELPGVFTDDSRPGTWGRKRVPIRIQTPARSVPSLDDAMCTTLGEFVRTTLAQSLGIEAAVTPPVLSRELDELPVHGVFVTVRRSATLRACRGRWASRADAAPAADLQLGALLLGSTRDCAQGDERFPSLTRAELPLLQLELSLLHSPRILTERGDELCAAIRIGEHGLHVSHPNGRGVLLPQVAVEQNWDAESFLHHVCEKAGLPAETWRTDTRLQVEVFSTRKLVDAAVESELTPTALTNERLAQLLRHAERGAANSEHVPLLNDPTPTTCGVWLRAHNGEVAFAVGRRTSLSALAERAAASFGAGVDRQLAEVRVLTQPLRLRASDTPQRWRTLRRAAFFAEQNQRWALEFAKGGEPQPSIDAALRAVDVEWNAWRDADCAAVEYPRVHAFLVSSYAKANAIESVRASAHAGRFYPRDAHETRESVEAWLTAGARAGGQGPERLSSGAVRAILLPHAGWRFCGRVIAETLAGVEVPNTVIVIGPKHTKPGERWSVPPHTTWEIPGARVTIAQDIVARLLACIAGLSCDEESHRAEHGTEVLLPFLVAKNPSLRVVPIVIGAASYAEIEQLGAGLARVCGELSASGRRVLLVISSDLHHFANETEGRRLDAIALDALRTGESRRLYDTCRTHRITMCGMRPAAVVLHALSGAAGEPPPRVHVTCYTTSAEASGDTSSVVGYAGAWVS